MRGLALFLVLAGCARPAPPSPWEKLGVRVVDGVPQLREVEIELTRTECFGWCPAYTVKLSGDGTLTYTGTSYVKAKGTHYDTLDPQKLLPLLERCAELDFLTRDHRCYVASMDNSHAVVTLRIGARTRTVRDSLVQRDDFPFQPPAGEVAWHRTMCDLEERIDALANIGSWIGTDAELEARHDDWR